MLNSHGVLSRNFALYSAFLLFLIVVSTKGTTSKEEEGNGEEWLLKNEGPCLSHGGICVKADYCPEKFRAKGDALCPEQESSGAACCHKVPEEASCRWHGGECMKDCGGARNFGEKNCTEGKTCCLLEFF